MVGRIAIGALVTLLLVLPKGAGAQDFPAYQGYPAAGGWAPESPYPGSIVPISYTPSSAEVYGYPAQPAALYDAGPADPAAPGPFPDAGYQGVAPYPPYSPNVPMAQDCHPLERGYEKFRGTVCCDALSDAFNGSWFRTEYLFWRIDDPGSALLGSPILGVSNPREYFDIVAPVVGMARVPDLSPIGLNDISGFRGTWGIPLTFGTLEIGGFVLEQASDHFFANDIPNTDNIFVATSTLIDGQISNLQRNYDLSYEATYISDVWGVNVNLVRNPVDPGEGFHHQPLAGFRFLSVRENLSQIGVTNQDPDPDWRTLIESDANNNIYGVNIGIESSLVHRWFTIGVRPQVSVGLNSFQNRVATERWVSPVESRVEHELSDTQFSAVGELTLFARVPLHETFNLHVGFTGMIITDLQRPYSTIVYDTTSDGLGSPIASHFHAKRADQSLKIYGLTVGGEWIFK